MKEQNLRWRIRSLSLVVFALALTVANVGFASNSAVVPVSRTNANWILRHESMNQKVRQGHIDLIYVGDSIVEHFDNQGKEVWDHYYAGRNALNLGISGDRTEHVLWRLDHGNIDGITPKLAIVMIGQNNGGHNTAEEIAEGVTAVVQKVRAKLPTSKILLLAIFQRREKPTPERAVLAEANDIVSKLADGKNIFYMDINSFFVRPDGSIPASLMPDFEHPSPMGHRIWAETTEPKVAELMGDNPIAPTKATDGSQDSFIGLQPGLGSLPLLGRGRTRSISAENPTGEKGKGGMAIPNPTEPKPAASARAADDLGQDWKVRPFIRLNARETAVLMDVPGPGVIQHIWMVEGLNRGLVIRFYWDGEDTPSVESPAPDFFAVGHGRFAPVNSLPVVVNPANAMNCFWPMPFRSHARITLSNETAEDVQLVAYQITYVETEVPAAAGTFHAQYRRATTAERNPYMILDGVKGRGRYVGTFLAWTQMEKGWFGEGEIKFYLDGDDRFPTICGTGTEDYFLGSYGFPRPFTTAYSGTVLPTSDGTEPPNFWSLYRWHIQDPINFEKDLRVTIQALGWGANGKYKKMADDISSVAYWYQAEPHAPFPKLPALAARLRDAK